MFLSLKKEKKYSYVEQGEGIPLVLLHGLMGGLSNFSALTDYFSQRGYKVYIPKLPIYSLPVLTTNVSGIAKFVNSFIKDIVKQPATLIGNSLGGHVGLVVSHKFPNQVNSLVLTGSSGLYEKSFGETFPKRGDYEYVKKKSEEVFYDPKVATKEIVDEVYSVLNDRAKALKTVYIARSAMKHNMAADLPSIKQPVLLIWGKQDNVTPPEVAVEFNKLLPNATLHWIDKCGHAPMMEHPDLFNEILHNWLKQINR